MADFFEVLRQSCSVRSLSKDMMMIDLDSLLSRIRSDSLQANKYADVERLLAAELSVSSALVRCKWVKGEKNLRNRVGEGFSHPASLVVVLLEAIEIENAAQIVRNEFVRSTGIDGVVVVAGASAWKAHSAFARTRELEAELGRVFGVAPEVVSAVDRSVRAVKLDWIHEAGALKDTPLSSLLKSVDFSSRDRSKFAKVQARVAELSGCNPDEVVAKAIVDAKNVNNRLSEGLRLDPAILLAVAKKPAVGEQISTAIEKNNFARNSGVIIVLEETKSGWQCESLWVNGKRCLS